MALENWLAQQQYYQAPSLNEFAKAVEAGRRLVPSPEERYNIQNALTQLQNNQAVNQINQIKMQDTLRANNYTKAESELIARGLSQANTFDILKKDPRYASIAQEKQLAIEKSKYDEGQAFWLKPFAEVIASGDNKAIKSIIDQMKSDTRINKTIPSSFDVQVNPKGETETITDITPNSVDPTTGKPWINPVTKQPLEDGTYKITSKNGVVMKTELHKFTEYENFEKGYKAKLKKEQPNLKTDEVQMKTVDEWQRRKEASAIKIAGERGKSYSENRLYRVLDTLNNNLPVWRKGSDINNSNDRYIDTSEGVKALNKTALIEDIRGNIDNVYNIIQRPNLNFDSTMQAEMSRLMTDRDPSSAISAFLDTKIAANLNDNQRDLLVGYQQLVENSMAMRSILGAGQGSEDMRNAIKRTINGIFASPEMGKAQLIAFNNTLNRLSRGIPGVKLRELPTEKPSTSLLQEIQKDNDVIIDGKSYYKDPKTGKWFQR